MSWQDILKKKAGKPAKGKRFSKVIGGKKRSYGQAGKAKDGDVPPCANALSRKKWKCRGSKSMRS